MHWSKKESVDKPKLQKILGTKIHWCHSSAILWEWFSKFFLSAVFDKKEGKEYYHSVYNPLLGYGLFHVLYARGYLIKERPDSVEKILRFEIAHFPLSLYSEVSNKRTAYAYQISEKIPPCTLLLETCTLINFLLWGP